MPPITPLLREKLLQQQVEMRVDEALLCPFDDVVLAQAWRRADDLEPDDAIELHHALLEKRRQMLLGAAVSGATAVSLDELVAHRGYTRPRIRQLDDDGLLAVKWDNPDTRRKGYVMRSELNALPDRLRARSVEEGRQRQLKRDFVAGRSRPRDGSAPDNALPECLR